MFKLISLSIVLSACTTDAPAKLPSCADVGCPTTAFCTGTQGSCSCVAAPGDSPVACERDPGVDAGQGTDASSSPVAPDGTWFVTYDQGADNCGDAEQTAVSEQIVVSGNGGMAELGGSSWTGTTTCTPSGCELVALFTFGTGAATSQQRVDLTLAPNGHITGSGSYAFTKQGATCTAQLTVTSGIRQ